MNTTWLPDRQRLTASCLSPNTAAIGPAFSCISISTILHIIGCPPMHISGLNSFICCEEPAARITAPVLIWIIPFLAANLSYELQGSLSSEYNLSVLLISVAAFLDTERKYTLLCAFMRNNIHYSGVKKPPAQRGLGLCVYVIAAPPSGGGALT